MTTFSQFLTKGAVVMASEDTRHKALLALACATVGAFTAGAIPGRSEPPATATAFLIERDGAISEFGLPFAAGADAAEVTETIHAAMHDPAGPGPGAR